MHPAWTRRQRRAYARKVAAACLGAPEQRKGLRIDYITAGVPILSGIVAGIVWAVAL